MRRGAASRGAISDRPGERGGMPGGPGENFGGRARHNDR